MSALGQKQTFCDAGAMSALPPKADILRLSLECPLSANSGHATPEQNTSSLWCLQASNSYRRGRARRRPARPFCTTVNHTLCIRGTRVIECNLAPDRGLSSVTYSKDYRRSCCNSPVRRHRRHSMQGSSQCASIYARDDLSREMPEHGYIPSRMRPAPARKHVHHSGWRPEGE
jgi:hypothetical protein